MSTPVPSPDACPPPLMWHDVRREFLAHSTAITVESDHGPVTARAYGSGPPIYLLPGFTSPAELYGLLVWLLKDEFRCVTLEPENVTTLRRRTGNSPHFGEYVPRLWAAADQLGDTEFSILGANFGAAWGLAAAMAEPARVTRLMLLHGFAHRRVSFLERRLAGWCRQSRRRLKQLPFREAIQTQNHRRWFPPFDATRWQYYLDSTGEMPLCELALRADAITRFDLRADLHNVSTPTLLIRTEGEGQVSAACQTELERSLPHARVEWMHSTGQLPYLTHPHRLAKLMRAFCQEACIEQTVRDDS